MIATYQDSASHAHFSVEQYERMIETGILTPDDRVELLENLVVLKLPGNPAHDGTQGLLFESLLPLLPPGYIASAKHAITLSDSLPEPDFTIVRGTPRSFLRRRPVNSEIGLLIEVANTSLLRDQRDKARIYARAAIADLLP